MLDVDQRRVADAEITRAFLARNSDVVDRLIARFGELAGGGEFAPYHFYLKGGNAIALLEGRPTEGDYDFQLMPPLEDYEDWPGTVNQVNHAVCHVLTESLRGFEAGFFDVSMFEVGALAGWAGTQGNPLQKAGISFEGVTQDRKREGMLLIGPDYGRRTFSEIRRDRRFRDGRIELDREELQARNLPFEAGPMIYVNYTIPGFILFRMVYGFRYVDAAGEEFFLKSEIIDVSLPRKGSAEVYLSQEGVITHFRPSGMGFNIPGWGYHLYENINLLQEISLGISGSPHKREKRLNRGSLALDRMLAVNPQGVVRQVIWEPHEGGNFQVLGYLGVLLYNVSTYQEFRGNVSRYNAALIQVLRERLLAEEASRFETTKKSQPSKGLLELLCGFRIDFHFDPAVKWTRYIKDEVGSLIRNYNFACRGVAALCMTPGSTYCFLTPYREIQVSKFFPMDYGVIAVVEGVYRNLRRYCDTHCGSDLVGVDGDRAFLLLLHCRCTFHIIFQSCGQVLPQTGVNFPEILQKSILESQRCPLAQYLERA